MTEYNARIELHTRDMTDTQVDAALDALDGFAPAISTGPTGHDEVIITVHAGDLRQAVTTALALVREATGTDVLAVEVMPTTEWDRRLGLEPLPELVSVTEAARMLDVSRQAVLQRLESGSLLGTKIGNSWALQRSAVASHGGDRTARKSR